MWPRFENILGASIIHTLNKGTILFANTYVSTYMFRKCTLLLRKREFNRVHWPMIFLQLEQFLRQSRFFDLWHLWWGLVQSRCHGIGIGDACRLADMPAKLILVDIQDPLQTLLGRIHLPNLGNKKFNYFITQSYNSIQYTDSVYQTRRVCRLFATNGYDRLIPCCVLLRLLRPRHSNATVLIRVNI